MGQTAVCYSNLAEAALYFDHVVPVSVFFDNTFRALRYAATPEQLESAPRVPKDFLTELLPPQLRNQRFIGELRRLYDHGVDAFLDWAHKARKHEITTPELVGFDQWLREVNAVAAKFHLGGCPIIAHRDLLPQAMGVSVAHADFEATMTSVHLVDADLLSWEQIREFRKDSASRMKLRRLRLFFAQNYAGKDRQYVEDDLHRLVDDYAKTIRTWGFETRAQIVTMLMNSKWVAGALTGSAFSALMGAPLAALVTAAGGLSLEVGHIALEVTKRKHELRRLAEDSPISYVVHLQQASQASPSTTQPE